MINELNGIRRRMGLPALTEEALAEAAKPSPVKIPWKHSGYSFQFQKRVATQSEDPRDPKIVDVEFEAYFDAEAQVLRYRGTESEPWWGPMVFPGDDWAEEPCSSLSEATSKLQDTLSGVLDPSRGA